MIFSVPQFFLTPIFLNKMQNNAQTAALCLHSKNVENLLIRQHEYGIISSMQYIPRPSGGNFLWEVAENIC